MNLFIKCAVLFATFALFAQIRANPLISKNHDEACGCVDIIIAMDASGFEGQQTFSSLADFIGVSFLHLQTFGSITPNSDVRFALFAFNSAITNSLVYNYSSVDDISTAIFQWPSQYTSDLSYKSSLDFALEIATKKGRHNPHSTVLLHFSSGRLTDSTSGWQAAADNLRTRGVKIVAVGVPGILPVKKDNIYRLACGSTNACAEAIISGAEIIDAPTKDKIVAAINCGRHQCHTSSSTTQSTSTMKATTTTTTETTTTTITTTESTTTTETTTESTTTVETCVTVTTCAPGSPTTTVSASAATHKPSATCGCMDIVIAMHSSYSLDPTVFNAIKKFVADDLLNALHPLNSVHVRYGLVAFSLEAEVQHPLTDNLADLNSTIKAIKYSPDSPYFASGVKAALSVLNEDSRYHAAATLVLITDGHGFTAGAETLAAQIRGIQARSTNRIVVFAVGGKSGIDTSFLEQFACGQAGACSNVVTVQNSDNLHLHLDDVLGAIACNRVGACSG